MKRLLPALAVLLLLVTPAEGQDFLDVSAAHIVGAFVKIGTTQTPKTAGNRKSAAEGAWDFEVAQAENGKAPALDAPALDIDAFRERLREQAAKQDAKQKAAEREEKLLVAVSVAGAVVGMVIIVVTARRLAATWRQRSHAFRLWVFGSICWAVGTVLYVWLVEPYGRMNDEEFWHMVSVMFVPPLFIGGAWFGYRRLVE